MTQHTYHRRSTRLHGYNYAQQGAYFVTICTHARIALFGAVADGIMRLTAAGRIAQDEWLNTPQIRSTVELDAFVVMPDHFHGIIVITDGQPHSSLATFRSPSQTIGAIVRGFKAAVTKQLHAANLVPEGVVWQRNYHDHIIRNDHDLNRIRRYIEENPMRWKA